MAGNYAHLFSTYTDEQLLELASQRDTLVDAGKAALVEEMKRRGYDPGELLASIAKTPFPDIQNQFRINAISQLFLRMRKSAIR